MRVMLTYLHRLGKDAVGRFQGKIDSLSRDLAATKAIAEATGF